MRYCWAVCRCECTIGFNYMRSWVPCAARVLGARSGVRARPQRPRPDTGVTAQSTQLRQHARRIMSAMGPRGGGGGLPMPRFGAHSSRLATRSTSCMLGPACICNTVYGNWERVRHLQAPDCTLRDCQSCGTVHEPRFRAVETEGHGVVLVGGGRLTLSQRNQLLGGTEPSWVRTEPWSAGAYSLDRRRVARRLTAGHQ